DQALREVEAFRLAAPRRDASSEPEIFVYRLKHAPAEHAARLVIQLIGDRGLRIAADPRTNSVLLRADRRAGVIVEAIPNKRDVPGAEVSAAVGPERAALEKRLAALEDQVAALKKELAITRSERSRPEEARTRTITLKHTKAVEVARVLKEALGNKGAVSIGV